MTAETIYSDSSYGNNSDNNNADSFNAKDSATTMVWMTITVTMIIDSENKNDSNIDNAWLQPWQCQWQWQYE